MARSAILFILRTADTYTVSLEITTEGPSALAGTVSVAPEDRQDVLTALDRAVGLTSPRGPLEPDPLSPIGRLMYGLFLPLPIHERLRTWDGALTVSTNDPSIPWELLHDGQDFLGVRHAVGRRLIMGRAPPPRPVRRRERPAFLFIADPEGDLESAAREARYLVETLSRRGFPCDLLMGERASYMNVQEALGSGRYDVIHYAGHAVSDSDNGGEGGLRLAGGRVLPAGQIERVLKGAPLVFLNACASARESRPAAEGRQVTALGVTTAGLASACILAGAQGFIGTLWPVQDEGSRQFAAFFYDRLLAGETIGQALRLTRMHLRQQRSPDPVWAAFVLYGDPAYRLCEIPAPHDRREVSPIASQVVTVTSPPSPVARARPATAKRKGIRTRLRTAVGVLSILALAVLLTVVGCRAYRLIGGTTMAGQTPVAAAVSSSPVPELAGPSASATPSATPSPTAPPSPTLTVMPSPTPVPTATPLLPSPTRSPTAEAVLPPTATLQQATATPILQGQIAFVSPDETGLDIIYVMNADGTGLRSLGPGVDPAWSPDQDRIAFAGLLEVQSGIHVINADGSGLARLTDGSDWQPTWSPDGQHIAFMSLRDGDREIYVMNADGSGLRRISNNPWQDRHPSWSPVGDRIAFISNRTGRWQIWVMASDGSGQVPLTDDDYEHFRPVWSPDGRQIAYGVWTGVRNEVWAMNADGSDQADFTARSEIGLVTDNAVYKLEYEGYGLAWAPSRLISFVSDRDGQPQIYVMNANGTGQRAVTAVPGGAWSPAWSFR